MSEYLKAVKSYEDISFMDFDTLEDTRARMVKWYEEHHQDLTGVPISMSPSDPMRATMNAVSLLLYQAEVYADRAGKMNLLKYAQGEFLDNLGTNLSVTRNDKSPAETTLRFTLSSPRPHVVGIPLGSLCSNGNTTYFKTKEYAEIPIGETYVDVVAACTENGTIGNELLPGQINTIINRPAYVESVANLDTTQGGAEVEDDESFKERIYLAPSSWSVAGPDDAYLYWTKTYNSNIGDVNIYSPTPVYVEIRFLLKDGSLPTDTMRKGLQDFLLTSGIRPLTDEVSVLLPEPIEFDLDFTYYISSSDMAMATQIQRAVDVAKDGFITWQTGSIGRDINPSELIRRIMAAGAKRVEVTAPEFIPVENTAVPRVRDVTVTYGGLEDD